MSLRINAEAPNFTANTTQGTIDFHSWIGDTACSNRRPASHRRWLVSTEMVEIWPTLRCGVVV